jgi:hypothetical protein
VYCAKFRQLLRGRLEKTSDYTDVTDWELVEAAMPAGIVGFAGAPAATELFQRDGLLRFFNEFFKTRIAARRVPNWD